MNKALKIQMLLKLYQVHNREISLSPLAREQAKLFILQTDSVSAWREKNPPESP